MFTKVLGLWKPRERLRAFLPMTGWNTPAPQRVTASYTSGYLNMHPWFPFTWGEVPGAEWGSGPPDWPPTWWQIDLGKEVDVYEINLQYGSPLRGFPINMIIDASNDGSTWTRIHAFPQIDYYPAELSTWKSDTPRRFRYWRFSQTAPLSGNRSWSGLSMVQMWAEKA